MKKLRISAAQAITQNHCELELRNNEESVFVKIFFDPDSFWIEIDALPPSVLFEAMLCHEDMIVGNYGDGENEEKKSFINIDWVIDEWDGPKDIKDALMFQKYNISNELPRLKEKYCKNVEKNIHAGDD